jgi:hypothetical protein
MSVHGVTYLDDGRAIEVQESHFRAESIEFIIELGEYSQYARLMPHDLLRRGKSTARAVKSTPSDFAVETYSRKLPSSQ